MDLMGRFGRQPKVGIAALSLVFAYSTKAKPAKQQCFGRHRPSLYTFSVQCASSGSPGLEETTDRFFFRTSLV